mmetsp:Transcript_28264/g.68783  ORF Transcript_28264/g.68783 Transcript_28264/m.68783 type:complete len:318 (+) Transcript_28264:79-1032(+)
MISLRCNTVFVSKNRHLRSMTKTTAKRTSESRRLSSTDSSQTTISQSESTAVSLVPRHGHGDRLIKLNVGGKEFPTLQSTLQASPVLAEYCARAEANGELESSGAIFIDRDPTHFAFILTFLRNKTEGIAYNSKQSKLSSKFASTIKGGIGNHAASATTTTAGSTASTVSSSGTTSSSSSSMMTTMTKMTLAKHPQYVRLPKIDDKNRGLLEDLFVEAQHYQLHELEYQLCKSSMWVTFMSSINGGQNPFQSLNEMLVQARRTALALAGGTSIYGFLQAELTWLEGLIPPNFRPPKDKSGDGNDTTSSSASEPSLAG